MKNKHILYGGYNLTGYRIYKDNNENYYSSGNNPWDSTQSLPPGDKDALSLKQIRKFCIKTGKEICQENGWLWKGAELEDIEEDI